MRTFYLRAMLALPVLAIAAGAHADYRFRLSAQANVFGLPNDFVTIDQTNGITAYQRVFEVTAGVDHARTEVDLSFGVMKARIDITNGFAHGNLITRLDDVLHFVNPGGGSIDVKFDLPTSGSITNPGPTTVAFAQTVLYVNGIPKVDYLRNYSGGNLVGSSDPVPVTMTFASGAAVNIQHYMSVQADGFQPGTTIVDYSHTVFPTIEVLTSGAGFTSDSGATYSPVPEPASMAVLGVGLLCVARRRRARKLVS